MVKTSSPLLQRIQAALDGLDLSHGRLHVSVARDTKWEKSKHGDMVLVRWLCWSIEDGDEEVVAKDVTRERLAAELPTHFANIDVVVDHEIGEPD